MEPMEPPLDPPLLSTSSSCNNIKGVGDEESATDERKVAVSSFLTLIGGRTYSLLRDLVSPEKPAQKKYSELVEILKTHFKPKPIMIAERFKF